MSEKKKKDSNGKGEWVIAYTPPGGGKRHSGILSRCAPDIYNDHGKIEEVKKVAKKLIASQLDNPNNHHYVDRDATFNKFHLVWIEKYELDYKRANKKAW